MPWARWAGLQSLKDWLHRRARAFTAEAHAFGLPEPRGLLLLGVQGCGKSLTAKAIASQWALPLLRLDMGRVFSGLIGSSEENLRRAIRVAESAAPAVLWIDEIDKALSGSASSNVSDGGTTARVLGTFLTWLQEKTAPVFVVATANRVEGLPPELLRKGRFDEIFFIDLPDAAEREEILRIHLRRRGREPERFDVAGVGRAPSSSAARSWSRSSSRDCTPPSPPAWSWATPTWSRRWRSRFRWRSPCGRRSPGSAPGPSTGPARLAPRERAPLKFLARFQRLERARGRSTEGPAGPRPGALLGAGVGGTAARGALPAAAAGSRRPGLPKPRWSSTAASDVQPFVRCQACGRDSQRGTVGCVLRSTAGHSGGRGVQRPALGGAPGPRSARNSAERQQALERGSGRGAATERQRRALGEELAREVAEREQRANAAGLPRWAWLVWVGLLGLVPASGSTARRRFRSHWWSGGAGPRRWWRMRRPPGQ